MAQESTIGVYIRNRLYYNNKPRRMHIYGLWKAYTLETTKAHTKGIKYNNFIRYVYVLRRLGLVVDAKYRGHEYVNVSPSVAKKHSRDEKTPDNWKKVFITVNLRLIDSPAWYNPQKAYRQLIGSEKYYGSPKAIQEKHDIEKEYRQKQKLKEILRPPSIIEKGKDPLTKEPLFVPNYTTIKVSLLVKKAIDEQRQGKSVNAWLTEHFIAVGFIKLQQ